MSKFTFYVPGSKHYDNGTFKNKINSFVNISVTGQRCECLCKHCQGQTLTRMLCATEPDRLLELVFELKRQGLQGVLISGGASVNGSVPLLPFAKALKKIGDWGIKVVVHTGLLTYELARMLSEAKVAQVALDLIGDNETIKEVYNLNKTWEDYQYSLRLAHTAKIKVTPHIVVGLHYGQIRGEYQALEMVADQGAASLILVIITPLKNTPFQNVIPPEPIKVERLFKTAREFLPGTYLSLGCARPAGVYSRVIEKLAVDCGFNSISYPAAETVNYVKNLGYSAVYRETCCDSEN